MNFPWRDAEAMLKLALFRSFFYLKRFLFGVMIKYNYSALIRYNKYFPSRRIKVRGKPNLMHSCVQLEGSDGGAGRGPFRRFVTF